MEVTQGPTKGALPRTFKKGAQGSSSMLGLQGTALLGDPGLQVLKTVPMKGATGATGATKVLQGSLGEGLVFLGGGHGLLGTLLQSMVTKSQETGQGWKVILRQPVVKPQKDDGHPYILGQKGDKIQLGHVSLQ